MHNTPVMQAQALRNRHGNTGMTTQPGKGSHGPWHGFTTMDLLGLSFIKASYHLSYQDGMQACAVLVSMSLSRGLLAQGEGDLFV